MDCGAHQRPDAGLRADPRGNGSGGAGRAASVVWQKNREPMPL